MMCKMEYVLDFQGILSFGEDGVMCLWDVDCNVVDVVFLILEFIKVYFEIGFF